MQCLSIQLSSASGVPYYRQIVEQIAQSIRSGQPSAKSRLPSVRELAAQLLVSLITVRRSYADLEAAGLIVRRQGRGTFVADEIEVASREQARTESRALLTDALAAARRLGLAGDELRRLLEDVLAQQGEEDGKP